MVTVDLYVTMSNNSSRKVTLQTTSNWQVMTLGAILNQNAQFRNCKAQIRTINMISLEKPAKEKSIRVRKRKVVEVNNIYQINYEEGVA